MSVSIIVKSGKNLINRNHSFLVPNVEENYLNSSLEKLTSLATYLGRSYKKSRTGELRLILNVEPEIHGLRKFTNCIFLPFWDKNSTSGFNLMKLFAASI